MTKIPSLTCLLSVAFLGVLSPAAAQETDSQVRVVVTEGVRARVAVADFQQRGSEMALEGHTRLFNDILWNDLRRAGVFELVPKSFYPLQLPSQPYEVNYEEWAAEDVRAQNLVYGNSYLQRGQFVVEARLIDVNTRESIIGNRYRVDPDEEGVRSLAHRFADEIVLRIGGGVRGIASTRIAFVSDRNGHKEIYTMDYDGYGQTALTNHRSISLTPRWSLDNSRIAYTSYHRGNPDLYFRTVYDQRLIPFPLRGGLTTTPAFAPDGERIAFSSSKSRDPEIYVSDLRGRHLRRLTRARGVDISPVWNPKTGRQIAFVSGRSGSPQIWIMDDDGSNLRRLITEAGEAVSPSWSPDGVHIAFSWRRRLTGRFDIYLLDGASGQFTQLTRDGANNEHPVWSPDSRHIAYESNRFGNRQVFLMLADGTQKEQLTRRGQNTAPTWSNYIQE